MAGQRIGSAKKNLSYHNALILHKSKNQTVKDQSSVVPAGAEWPIIAISKDDYKKHIDEIISIKNRVKIQVCYESLYKIEDEANYDNPG